MPGLVEPTMLDVLAAAARIRPHLAPTPLRHSVAISEMVGTDGLAGEDEAACRGRECIPLAAALALRGRLSGRRVALILTGGNISIPQLKEVLK
jgi:threonine dehydratase